MGGGGREITPEHCRFLLEKQLLDGPGDGEGLHIIIIKKLKENVLQCFS